MRVLISNDDGYKADGIIQLAKSLSEIAEVIVVAPSENKSAASSSLSIGKPLKPIQIENNVYKEWTVTGSKGNQYLVIRQEGKYNCNCPGFQFRKNCRHVKEIVSE